MEFVMKSISISNTKLPIDEQPTYFNYLINLNSPKYGKEENA